jgi:hypothetical protein
MPRNELRGGRVESVSEEVVGRVVKGHRVLFAIACLRGEGQPIGDLVALSLEVLRAEAVRGVIQEERYLPRYELNGQVVG